MFSTVVLALTVVLVGGCTTGRARPPAPAEPQPQHVAPLPPQLPGGGRSLLPERRLVGFSGGPASDAFGPLTGDLDEAGQRMHRQAAPYGTDRQVQPVFELIATVAHAAPGADGKYRNRADDETIAEYLAAARRHGAVLLLGIQPGQADFLEEVRHYARWLSEPDVGVALDPEWAVGPDEVPGQTFGSTTGSELNDVADYLSHVVRRNDLPQKAMVYHQLSAPIVHNEHALAPHPQLAMIKSVDGIGSAESKTATWKQLTATKPPHVAAGFKLFFNEDTRNSALMAPSQVLSLSPQPKYVLYE